MSALVRSLLALLLTLSLGFQGGAHAQSRPAYTQQELDQMLAPIALYPDALLSQVLMAATYPLEVAEAASWSQANPGLDGDQAVRAVADRDWDPSVKSLVAFPQLLARLDENPQWVVDLGDAFLGQEAEVMDSVQGLRRRAQAAGTLASDERMRVEASGPTVIVEPAQPQLVYVPYYDPYVAYGSWWYPAYPPVRWAPWPGYRVVARPHRAHSALWWGTGVGLSAGFFFGNVDWHRRHVRVARVDNYYYRRPHVNAAPGVWRHEPAHRRGFAYRDAAVQDRFGRSDGYRAEQRARALALPAARPVELGPALRPNGRDEERRERTGERRERPEERRERRGDGRWPEHRSVAPASAIAAPSARSADVAPAVRDVAPAARPWAEERRERRSEARWPEHRPAAPASAIALPPARPAGVAPVARPNPPPRERHDERRAERREERREHRPEAPAAQRPAAMIPAPAQARPVPVPQTRAAEPRVQMRLPEARRAEPVHRAAPTAQQREVRNHHGARRAGPEARGHGRMEMR